MSGNQSIKFSELFADTAAAHGIEWAYNYYVVKHNMSYWEFKFWANTLGFNENGYYQ